MRNSFKRQTLFKLAIKTKGFTLPELLIAAAISLGVVSLGGFGLVSILTSSQVANAQNERKTELNRSLEFISDEIRQSERIGATLPSGVTLPTEATSDAQAVLMLYPDIGSTQPIIYYVDSPSSSENTWRGPKLVYRWGPKYKDDGTYLNSDSTTWTPEPLIDAIEDSNTAPTCSDSSLTPTGNLGFGACVSASTKVAELYHAGIFNKPIQGTEVYTAQTTTVARSTQAATDSFDPPPGTDPAFTVNDGVVTIRKPSTMSIRVLGGKITCNPGGPDIPRKAAYHLIPGREDNELTITPAANIPDIPVLADTTLTVQGEALPINTCKSLFAKSNESPNQVLTLTNGASIPEYAPFDDQPPIQSFLRDYIDSDQITIQDNEVIFLFELGGTNPTNSTFDMQDLVILATITPNS